MASVPITSWQIDGETMDTVTAFIFWAPKSLRIVTAAMKLKDACSLEEKLRQTCCCCWVALVVSDSVQPRRWQPTRLPVPRILQARTLEWVAIFFSKSEVKSESEVAQSCPTLSNPMDCSPPGSSVHGISQARVLEWGAIAFSDDKPKQHIKK